MTPRPDIAALKGMMEKGTPGTWRWLSMEHHIDIDWVGVVGDDCARLYANVAHILTDGEPSEATKDHENAEKIVAALNALPWLITVAEAGEAFVQAVPYSHIPLLPVDGHKTFAALRSLFEEGL